MHFLEKSYRFVRNLIHSRIYFLQYFAIFRNLDLSLNHQLFSKKITDYTFLKIIFFIFEFEIYKVYEPSTMFYKSDTGQPSINRITITHKFYN